MTEMSAKQDIHHAVNYLELPASDLAATKAFFQQVFNWQFVDYGPDYIAFSDAVMEGGFFKSDKQARTESGSALIVFFSDDLEASEQQVIKAGGEIIQSIFSFPGGRRFHFLEPSGSEFAVWSKEP